MMGKDGQHPIFETAHLNKIIKLSFMNFKAFRILNDLNALRFKKLNDASLTDVDAVNEASFISPLSSQNIL